MAIFYRRAIGKRLLVIGAAALTAAAVFGEVIYENDFATRTSAGVVPMSEWRTCNYVTGFLANTNGAAPFTATGNVIQDGWIKEKENTTGNVYCENAMVWAGVSGKDNPAAVLGRNANANASSCVVKQRLGNTFTNGTLTAQFDFMPPGQWVSYGGNSGTLRRVNISFGDERFYSPAISQDNKIYRYTAGGVGVALHSADGTNRKRKVWYNANIDFANTNMTETVVTLGNWLRAVVTIDLDARKWGFSMFDIGAHPEFDTATPATPVYTASNLPFSDDSVTSISSIALVGVGVSWGSNGYSASTEPTHTAWFDNIRISHNGELCYENDFATRRWRIFGGTASHTYVADCLVTNSVKNEVYVNEKYLVTNRVDNGTTVQPIGTDGWRRTHHENGTANAWVRSDNNGGPYLRFNCNTTDTTSQGYLAQPFGSIISSGKVRLAVDARLPSGWDANGILWVTLAGDQYYNADPKTARSKYRWASVGIRGADNTPTYIYDTNGNARNPTPDAPITKEHWYRLVVTADLDAKTTDFSVFEQGTSYPNSDTANGTCIFTTNGIPKIGTASPLTCFSLGAVKRLVYFDNVKIWHIPTGSETETLLYENDFTTRTIYSQDTRVAQLVGKLRLDPEGQDSWTRAYSSESGVFVDWADNNPALTFVRDGSETWAVQDIGQTVKNGILLAQADIKPPKGWLENGGSTYVRLGGDKLRQSPLRRDDNYFLNNIAMGFGFKNTSPKEKGKIDNLYTNSTIAAFRGDLNAGGAMENAEFDVDTTHWYRFVATTVVPRNQYDVAVYDMGTEHPTLATPTPETPVVTYTELPFRRTKAVLGGISCIAVSGHKAAQSMCDQSLEPLVDNLRVSHTAFGSRIVVK